MTCRYCNGLVLWDIPLEPYGDNTTTCQGCGARNSQLYEAEDEEVLREESGDDDK